MEVGLVLLSGQNFRISFLEKSSTNFFFFFLEGGWMGIIFFCNGI